MGYYVNVSKDVNIYVEDLNPEGQKAILFLHGWPGSHKLFEYQFNKLPQLGFRCIGIDTRGFGDSSKPFFGYDYNTLADDVRCVVEALGLRDFTLAGHSTGGAIAVKYMGRHRGYGVSRLVLIAAAAPSLIRRPNFPYGIDKEKVLQMIEDTYNDRPMMLRNFGDNFFYRHISQPFSDWFFQLGLQAAGWATASIAKTWINEVLFSETESIHVPTLIMHGIHDRIVPFNIAEVQHRLIANSVLVPFEFSGHGVFYDQKDEFNEVLAKFVANKL
ncbi:alpha/beta hydrolase fold protein [Thermoclostridium stercorarium subsp. stercorarium DSM 8532]|jgi:non-heme chloroperoxidase|uniref:Alpha/beta hydrolase fold protein n=2 Tax=Thermoclostridium stercorarium TaxID=1510 RepID=L7VPK9_THES1|nr:alpha/beta hydrolase [Thermoclostridium stercorarium]AGC68717.1 alpha/beta hydrolase fold protein [Thermoclostridium stercorarium subsp. stercorarium DSM 8532]AGI39726.1 hydrolase [Thermoclostridium stercorarium subsp. stercorarium DSM 8532]ANX01578.1 alpha/beta hydrolase [Thermoclostridium stercorarium subsp. leptospartum DSM 9219]UZQ84697.1 alpha/beta hydrolase [Thermoclostridium stercorarium]